MAKEYYMRIQTAGRYRKVVHYSRSLPCDSPAVRNAKKTATAAAQRFINVKNATERLQLLLCANFDSKEASFCTFTFTDQQLPANRKHTRAIFRAYLEKLRKEWKRQGRELPYIYTVEGDTLTDPPETRNPDGNVWELAPWRERDRWEQLDHTNAQDEPEPPTRLHVHCFLLLRKTDVEAVKALWPYGQAYVNAMRVNDLSAFHRLAAYITKESREGSTGNGERAYIPSLGLQKPEISGHRCSEYEGLTAPKEAEIIQSGAERNEIYGTSMEFIYYRMPRPIQPPKPYRSKGKLPQKGRKKP